MVTSPPHHRLKVSKTNVVLLLVAILTIYILVPRFSELKASGLDAEHANSTYTLITFSLVVLSYVFASITYQLLAKHRLGIRRTLIIQIAASLANRLLPAGIGGLSLNMAYLVKNKHNVAEASSVAAANNILGVLGHLLLLGSAVLLVPGSLKLSSNYHVPGLIYISVFLAVAGLCLSLIFLPRVRHWLEIFSWQVFRNALAYRRHPIRLFLSLISSLSLTFCYVFALMSSMLSIGVHLGFTQVLVIFTLGAIIGTLTPTPGGLIGVEVGLVAGFVAFGISGPSALSIVLIYRFISYWLPILPGFVAIVYARRRNYIG